MYKCLEERKHKTTEELKGVATTSTARMGSLTRAQRMKSEGKQWACQEEPHKLWQWVWMLDANGVGEPD